MVEVEHRRQRRPSITQISFGRGDDRLPLIGGQDPVGIVTSVRIRSKRAGLDQRRPNPIGVIATTQDVAGLIIPRLFLGGRADVRSGIVFRGRVLGFSRDVRTLHLGRKRERPRGGGVCRGHPHPRQQQDGGRESIEATNKMKFHN